MKHIRHSRRINLSSIRTKLVFVILILVILSITATKVYDYIVRVPEIERTVKEERLNIAVLTASRMETEIFKAVSAMETAANNATFVSDDNAALIKLLFSIKNENQIFSTVFIADASLNKLNEKGETSSLANREYMQEVKKTKKTVISREILISQSTKKPSIMIATPIKVSGAAEKYLGVSINIDKLQYIIGETKKSDSNYAFAFDSKNGLIFAHPVKEYIGTLKLINPEENDKAKVAPELKKMAEVAVSGKSDTQIYDFNDSRIIAAYANISGTSFGVAARMNYDDAMEPVMEERNSAIIIILIASLISTVIAMVFAKFIADPIKSIASQANIISYGDFTKAINITVKGENEVGQLEKAFKDMAVMLKATMEQIGQATTNIASSSEVLKVNAEQSAKGAAQVAETVADVAEGVTDQLNAVDSAIVTVKGIDNEISKIAGNASEVALLSKNSATAAVDGVKAIDHAIESITNINVIVQDTAGAIRDLGTFSDQISQIVDTISGIASQTNLLALNAAIEAVRAGEQGRGFSVVADEVRKLAEQSKEAAGTISHIIANIQSQTKYAVEKMDKSAEEVTSGQGIVLAAGESFKMIQNQIDNVDQAIHGITLTVHGLSASSCNVIASVEKIRGISQETAANSQTISAATEEQSASMQEVASSAEALARLSDQLEDSLRQYKF